MLRALVPLLAVLGLLAGCGSGDEGDASRDEFIADANAICRDGERQITGRFEDEQPTPESLSEIADAYEPYLERLRELEPPGELEPGWRDFLAGVDEGFDLLPDLARAAESNDAERLQEISERAEEIAADTRPFAQTHGLDGCLPAQDEGG